LLLLKSSAIYTENLTGSTKIDKDATIIEQFALPGIDMASVSPVRRAQGVTKSYLTNPDHQTVTHAFESEILSAVDRLRDKRVIVAEGTGHLGVGGIVGLSNSRVSRLLDAPIVYVAGGGIGKTLDMLEVDFTYLRCTGARIGGVIFNKLLPDKIEQMRALITEEYLTHRFGSAKEPIRIFGFMPKVARLDKPSMEQVWRSFPDALVAGNVEEEAWQIPSAGVSIISQSHRNLDPAESINCGDIVMLSSWSRRRLRMILDYNASLPTQERIAGLLLTSTKERQELAQSMTIVARYGVPALYVAEDTHTADEKLYGCIKNTKLQSYDGAKNAALCQGSCHLT
jgi:hypothetical protein